MKLFIAVLAACLVMSVYSQAATGGASGPGASGAAGVPGLSGLLGGNVMGLAAMTGQLGDGFQRMARCQIMGLPVIFCMNM